MYLLANFCGHRSYGNGDINPYINSYMSTSEKTELTALVRHIEKFSKSGIPIYNSEVPHCWQKIAATRTTKTQVITKRYAFYANAKIKYKLYNIST